MSKLITYKFSDLYSMSSGISSKPEQAGHGCDFVSFKTVFNNYFLPETLTEFMDISEKDKELYSIKKGDVFLTRTSETLDELGMSCVAVKDYPSSSYSGFLKRLRPTQNDVTYDKYMAFYLRSDLFRKTMTNNAIMTLRASLNEQIFSYLELILPDFNEQKKAGDLLFALNQKIEINNKINSELEAMAKTLYDYWFVQFDFPFDFAHDKRVTSSVSHRAESRCEKPYKTSGGKMVWNEELKREIPEGWEVKKIEEVSDVKAGGDKPKEYSEFKNEKFTFPIYSNGITNEGLYGYAKDAKITKQSITVSARGTIGYCVLRNRPFVPIIRLIVVTPRNSYEVKYFFEFIKNIAFENSGSVQQQLTVPQISNLKIKLPPTDILKKYELLTSSGINKIEINKEENQQLASLRDWLLPMLMNGQVRVGDVEEVLRQAQDDILGMVAEPSIEYKK